MKEDILNEESKITQRFTIKKIINRLYKKVIEIENKFNRCRLFWELMNIALDLDSFSMCEFCYTNYIYIYFT